VACPSAEGRDRLLERTCCMADRGHRPDPHDLADEDLGAGKLGGERDDLDLALEPGHELPERLSAWRKEPLRIEGAGPLWVEERAFEVDPEDARYVGDLCHRLPHPVQWAGDDRGDEPGRAVLGMEPHDRLCRVGIAVGEICSRPAVNVEVEESGGEVPAFGIQVRLTPWVWRLAHGHDAAAQDEAVPVANPRRSHHPRAVDEEVPVALHICGAFYVLCRPLSVDRRPLPAIRGLLSDQPSDDMRRGFALPSPLAHCVAGGADRLSLAAVSPARRLWSGNVAVAEGALAAGLDFYAGYPITPSSAIMEHLARELPKRGGTFLQAEDEIASVFMLIGAAWAGGRVLTATSGPGFSLMQEGLGIAIMTETPLVVVDVMRLGPGTGQASRAGQGDLMQARWGRHGDQHLVVYAPTSAQDCFDLAVRAVNTAERLRVPAVLLSDEIVAHTWEGVVVPDTVERVERPRFTGHGLPFASDDPRVAPPMPSLGEGHGVLMTASTHDGRGVRFTSDPAVHRALATRLVDKIRLNAEDLAVVEEHGTEGAAVGIVAYGSAARAALAAREILAAQGVRLGVVVLKTLWPLPEEPIRRLAEGVRRIVVPELSLGQLVLDVERVAAGRCEVDGLSKIGGGLPFFPSEIAARATEAAR